MPNKSTEALYDRSGIGETIGFGTDPALVVVDMQVGVTDPERPAGFDQSDEIAVINRLAGLAREYSAPVVFTRVCGHHPDGADFGIWPEKVPTVGTLQVGTEDVALDGRLTVDETDHVLDKQQASAFYETSLGSILTAEGVDTAIIMGNSTSGCVRATVTDACARGYRVIVPEAAVADRAPEAHSVNLFDIDSKYGDVVEADVVEQYLRDFAG